MRFYWTDENEESVSWTLVDHFKRFIELDSNNCCSKMDWCGNNNFLVLSDVTVTEVIVSD